jgi:hypothetical protein
VSRKRKMDILICHLVMSVLRGVALPPLSVSPLPVMVDILTLSTPKVEYSVFPLVKVFFIF